MTNKNFRMFRSNLLFDGIEQSEIKKIFNQKKIKTENEGELIYKSGEESEYLYLILDGEVKIKFHSVDSVSSRISKTTNDFFGHNEILGGTTRNSSAVADTDCTLYLIDRNELIELSSENSIIYKNLKGELGEEQSNIITGESAESLNPNDQLNNFSDEEIKEVPDDTQKNSEGLPAKNESKEFFPADVINDEVTTAEEDSFFENNLEKYSNSYEPEEVFSKNNFEKNELNPENEPTSGNENSQSNYFRINLLEEAFDKEEEFSLGTKSQNTSEDNANNVREYEQNRLLSKDEYINGETINPADETTRFIINNISVPVQSIKRISAILKKKFGSGEISQLADMISKYAENIPGIAETALNFKSDRKEKHFQLVKINEVINDILPVLYDYSDSNNVKLYKKIDTEAYVSIDKAGFFNACLQITKNAIEAMPEGGNLFITVNREGNQVKIEFIDEGPGIPSSVKEEIFEPFSTHGKQDGVGLGLSITKKIIEEHNGYIFVESELGEGTKVIINLPVAE
jgi:CRP-like cAMP-binding protein